MAETTADIQIQNLMALLEQEREKNVVLAAVNEELKSTVTDLKSQIASLTASVANLQRMLFGRKSERVVASDAQPLLPGMEEAMGALQEQTEDEPEQTTPVRGHERAVHRGQPNAGWNGFPADLPREEVIIDVPEAERGGRPFKGYSITERLVHRQEYIVRVVKRAIYEDAVSGTVTAPLPPVPSCLSLDSDRCHYDASVVVHAIVEKLLWHMPFYRQEAKMAAMGIGYGRSAMCCHFARVSSALEGLYMRVCELILAGDVIHADETHIDMLDPGGGGKKTCWIWARRSGVGPPLTAFYFSLHRDSATAKKLLGDYTGTVIRDAYVAYDCLSADAAGCWAHVRRHFFRAEESLPEEVGRALALIRRMYAIERGAKEAAEARDSETALFKERKRRRTASVRLVDDFFVLCREIIAAQPPSLPAAKAAAYALKEEEALRRFLENPKLNIDNNPCENVIRPICVGRKNWLFVGSEDGGISMAILASFAAICKDNDVDLEEWLLDVIYRLDDTPASELDTLLPHIWKQRRAAAAAAAAAVAAQASRKS